MDLFEYANKVEAEENARKAKHRRYKWHMNKQHKSTHLLKVAKEKDRLMTIEEKAKEYYDEQPLKPQQGEYAPNYGKGKKNPKRRGRPRLPDNRPLSIKQEAYCRYRVERGLNKTRSYEMAFGMNTADPYRYAWQLEKKPHIINRMRKLREERAMVAKFYGGPEEALARWDELYQIAMKDGDLKLAIKAQENIDKITGADKANLMNDEVSKTMFLNQHAAENEKDFQNQISNMLIQISEKSHSIKKTPEEIVELETLDPH